MKIKITNVDPDGTVQPMIRDTFFLEEDNGRVDIIAWFGYVERAWIDSWEMLFDIPAMTQRQADTMIDECNRKYHPFRQAIQRKDGTIHYEEYRNCKIEIVPDDYQIEPCNYPLEFERK